VLELWLHLDDWVSFGEVLLEVDATLHDATLVESITYELEVKLALVQLSVLALRELA
jgi:hypothetical protein